MEDGREQLNNNPPPYGRNGRASGNLVAIILIALGVLLFVQNLGVWDMPNIGQLWPMAVAAYGAALFARSCRLSGKIWGMALLAWGGLVTLGNFGYMRVNAGNAWPIFIIAAGFSLLLGRGPRMRRWERRQRTMQFAADLGATYGESATQAADEIKERMRRRWREPDLNPGRINDQAVFGGIQRRHETNAFEGGEVDAVFGSVELDLTRAAIAGPKQEAVLETNAVFGGIRIRVPDTWRINFKGSAVLGGFEDKTIPPRVAPGETAPVLTVTGAAVFGGVEFTN